MFVRNLDKYEDEYIKEDFEKYQVIQRRKAVLRSVKGRKRILEIGCGMEPLFMFTDWEVEEYTVFEPGERFMSNARKLADKEMKKVAFYQKPFTADKTLIKADFDAVVCSSLLHEIQDPVEMLKDIFKVAGDKTLIHINVPNARSFHRLLAMEMGYIKDIKQFSKRNVLLQQNSIFDMDDLKNICVAAGLEVVESGSYFIKPFTHDQMQRGMEAGIINEDVLDGLFEMAKYMPEYGSEIYVNCVKK